MEGVASRSWTDTEIAGLSFLSVLLAIAALNIPPAFTNVIGYILGGGSSSVAEFAGLCFSSYFTAKIFQKHQLIPGKREFLTVSSFFVLSGVFGILQLSGLISSINGNPLMVSDMGGELVGLSFVDYFEPFIPMIFYFVLWYRRSVGAENLSPVDEIRAKPVISDH